MAFQPEPEILSVQWARGYVNDIQDYHEKMIDRNDKILFRHAERVQKFNDMYRNYKKSCSHLPEKSFWGYKDLNFGKMTLKLNDYEKVTVKNFNYKGFEENLVIKSDKEHNIDFKLNDQFIFSHELT